MAFLLGVLFLYIGAISAETQCLGRSCKFKSLCDSGMFSDSKYMENVCDLLYTELSYNVDPINISVKYEPIFAQYERLQINQEREKVLTLLCDDKGSTKSPTVCNDRKGLGRLKRATNETLQSNLRQMIKGRSVLGTPLAFYADVVEELGYGAIAIIVDEKDWGENAIMKNRISGIIVLCSLDTKTSSAVYGLIRYLYHFDVQASVFVVSLNKNQTLIRLPARSAYLILGYTPTIDVFLTEVRFTFSPNRNLHIYCALPLQT